MSAGMGNTVAAPAGHVAVNTDTGGGHAATGNREYTSIPTVTAATPMTAFVPASQVSSKPILCVLSSTDEKNI